MARNTPFLSPIEKEKRRRKAVSLKSKGWTQKQIAEELKVSEAAVSQWFRRFEREGEKGLAARKHTGRPPKLTDEELEENILLAGSVDEGLWKLIERVSIRSASQIAAYLEGEFSFTYHESHLSRLLRRLGWQYGPVKFLSDSKRKRYAPLTDGSEFTYPPLNKMRCWQISPDKLLGFSYLPTISHSQD